MLSLNRKQTLAFHLVFIIIVAVSFLLSTHLTLAFVKIFDLNHFQLQANCLQHGKIGLCRENGADVPTLSVTDASNYNGKSQAYWGPLSTLLPLVLNNYLHLDVSEQGQVFVMTTATLYMFFLLLSLTVNALFPGTPQGVRYRYSLFGVVLVGLSSFYLHVASFSFSWFISIAAAQFFVIAHWLLIIIYLFYRKSDAILILIGAAAGFGLLSKQAFLPSFTISILMMMLYASANRSFRQRVSSYAAIIAPFALCLAFLLLWNFVRFDDPFDNGISYQNGGGDWNLVTPVRWNCNLYNFLLAPFSITADLPFIEYRFSNINECLLHTIPSPPIPLGAPIFLSILLSPFFLGVDIGKNKKFGAANILLLEICIFLVPITLINLGPAWSAMRFVYDIGWLLTLAAVLILLQTRNLIETAKKNRRAHSILKFALLSYLILSLAIQFVVAVDYVLGDTIGQRFMYAHTLVRETDAEYVRTVNSLINPIVKYMPFYTAIALILNP